MDLDLCHVSQQMDDFDLFWGFRHGFTQSLFLRTSDIPNSDTFRDLRYACEGLNPMQLLLDRMAKGYLSEDPTDHNLLGLNPWEYSL
jgi:hypothetical protein